MQRVTYRTLVLLLMLLALILVQEHTAKALCVKPGAVWLAHDPNEPPEYMGSVALPARCAADDPNDPPQPGPPEYA